MNGENDTTPLDLNILPKEYGSKDNGKQTQFDAGSSSSGHSSRKKKKREVESGKLYECRFCNIKFYKSQALGGHMNRHRQEREIETLNKARMLVFSNENNMSTIHGHPAAHQLGTVQIAVPNGGFHHEHVITNPSLHFKPAYPVQSASMKLPASSKSLIALQHHINSPQPYMHPSLLVPHFGPTNPNYLSKPSNVHGTTSVYIQQSARALEQYLPTNPNSVI